MYCPTDRHAIDETVQTIYNASSRYRGGHRVAPHRLATLLMIFALAEVFTSRNQSRSSPALRYFAAASTLLSLPKANFLVHHSLAAVECLHLMVSFLFATGQQESAKAAWPLLGSCVRLACGLGLHRDAATWGLNNRQKNQRGKLWWDCLTYDILCVISLTRSDWQAIAQLWPTIFNSDASHRLSGTQ